MIYIEKSAAPVELTQLEQDVKKLNVSTEEEYNHLKNPLKRTVRESLLHEQGHLCAYCMCRILSDNSFGQAQCKIEHYIPRNDPSCPERHGTGLGLAYRNLLAVCSGHSGETCDASRGNTKLTVNPLDKTTLESIRYFEDGTIEAGDSVIDEDIQETLKLNCTNYFSLPEERKHALSTLQKELSEVVPSDLKQECEDLLKFYEQKSDPKEPYCGILIWWLKDFLTDL